MTRIRWIPAFVMIIILISEGMGYCASESAKESLRGLKGVCVVVEDLDPNIEKDGLHENSIKTDVELKLQMSGIKVLTWEEIVKEPGLPNLYVRVNTFKRGTNLYAYHIDVELHQNVLLERDPKIVRVGATTWRAAGMTGTISTEHNVNLLRNTVNNQVEQFINDYLAVNPK